jgi:hypothetical protein
MKVRVGQDFVYNGYTKKYVHIIKVWEKHIEYKEYKSYKDKTFAKMRDLDVYICYMTPEELFLKHYRPVDKKVRRIE